MDRLGLASPCQGLLPVAPNTRLARFASTARYRPCGPSAGNVGDFPDEMGLDPVVVIDNGARLAGTVWGDILTVFAQRHELRHPIFTRGRSMITGKGRAPLGRTSKILLLASGIDAAERRLLALVEQRMGLRQARGAVNYHAPQNRSERNA